MTKSPKTVVRATETSLRILEALKDFSGAGITELANDLDLPKSTVHNHLQTLIHNEYVIKNGDEYDVSLRFLEFGEYVRTRRRIAEIGPPEIDKLADRTNELTNLVVEEHGRGVFLYRAKGADAVHMDTHAGKRVYLHTTAFGKAILAHLPDERVHEIIDRHGLVTETDRTISSMEQLFDELESIREVGYAFDDEERLSGLRCVAVPVLTQDLVVGAISVSGPKSRMTGDWYRSELPSLLQSTANVIEINITYA